MAKPRKRRTEKEIHEDIIKFLEEADFPRTTEEIANNVGLNWHSATTHLTKLRMEGKVFHKKVGKQNQWLLKEKYDHGFLPDDETKKKIREMESLLKELEKKGIVVKEKGKYKIKK